MIPEVALPDFMAVVKAWVEGMGNAWPICPVLVYVRIPLPLSSPLSGSDCKLQTNTQALAMFWSADTVDQH